MSVLDPLRSALGWLRSAVAWLFSRQHVAVGLMAAGVCAATVGFHLMYGMGPALIVLAVCLIVLALLIGWE